MKINIRKEMVLFKELDIHGKAIKPGTILLVEDVFTENGNPFIGFRYEGMITEIGFKLKHIIKNKTDLRTFLSSVFKDLDSFPPDVTIFTYN